MASAIIFRLQFAQALVYILRRSELGFRSVKYQSMLLMQNRGDLGQAVLTPEGFIHSGQRRYGISKKAGSIQGLIGADSLIPCSHGLAGSDTALHGMAYTYL